MNLPDQDFNYQLFDLATANQIPLVKKPAFISRASYLHSK
jgi:hypothetical protein